MTNIRSFTTLRSYLNVITPQTRHRADCQSVLSVVVQLGCIYIRACLLDFGQSRNKYASTCKTMSLSELNRSERANDGAKHKNHSRSRHRFHVKPFYSSYEFERSAAIHFFDRSNRLGSTTLIDLQRIEVDERCPYIRRFRELVHSYAIQIYSFCLHVNL